MRDSPRLGFAAKPGDEVAGQGDARDGVPGTRRQLQVRLARVPSPHARQHPKAGPGLRWRGAGFRDICVQVR
jgi:hypothetical protein